MKTQTAANISAGTCFPFALDNLNIGDAVIVGHGPNLYGVNAVGTYLGHTLDGLAVIRIDDSTIDGGAGMGIEEWPIQFVQSLKV